MNQLVLTEKFFILIFVALRSRNKFLKNVFYMQTSFSIWSILSFKSFIFKYFFFVLIWKGCLQKSNYTYYTSHNISEQHFSLNKE